MLKPTAKELDSFARLVRTPDGRRFMEYLEQDLRAVQYQLIDAKDADLPTLRGEARKVRDVFKLLQGAMALETTLG